jgi:hypothetical protein
MCSLMSAIGTFRTSCLLRRVSAMGGSGHDANGPLCRLMTQSGHGGVEAETATIEGAYRPFRHSHLILRDEGADSVKIGNQGCSSLGTEIGNARTADSLLILKRVRSCGFRRRAVPPSSKE